VAVLRGYSDCVKVLVERGADLRFPCDAQVGDSPLHRAVYSTDKTSTFLPYLLDHGADLNQRNKAGRTAMDVALATQNATAVRLLRERGAKEGAPRVLHLGIPVSVGENVLMSSNVRWDLFVRPSLLVYQPLASTGFGAFAEVGTHTFSDLLLGGGLDGLLAMKKWSAYFSPSLGGYARRNQGEWGGGCSAGVFYGKRYTFLSTTGATAWSGTLGVRLQGRYALSGERDHSIGLALEADPAWWLRALLGADFAPTRW